MVSPCPGEQQPALGSGASGWPRGTELTGAWASPGRGYEVGAAKGGVGDWHAVREGAGGSESGVEGQGYRRNALARGTLYTPAPLLDLPPERHNTGTRPHQSGQGACSCSLGRRVLKQCHLDQGCWGPGPALHPPSSRPSATGLCNEGQKWSAPFPPWGTRFGPHDADQCGPQRVQDALCARVSLQEGERAPRTSALEAPARAHTQWA